MASEAGGGHFYPDGPDEAGDSPCPTDPAVAIDEALTGEERAAYPTSVTVAERAAIVSTWQCAAEQAREAITRELPDAEAPRE